MDAIEGAATFGFRKREAFRALLDIYVQLLGGMANGVMQTYAGVKIKRPDDHQNADRAVGEPGAQALGIEGHDYLDCNREQTGKF